VVDVAMTDGAASLMTMTYSLFAAGLWRDERGQNLLDTGAHFYDVYETRDGKYVALGSIEPQFYRELRERAGLDDPDFDKQMDRAEWPSLKEKIAAVMRTRTRDEWDTAMLGSDVCYAPVLSLTEASQHPHNRARETFIEVDGVMQPAPAPRFSRTPPEVAHGPRPADTEAALADWGFSASDIDALKSAAAI
jgi:alpha-methylacyl-CoA racemase